MNHQSRIFRFAMLAVLIAGAVGIMQIDGMNQRLMQTPPQSPMVYGGNAIAEPSIAQLQNTPETWRQWYGNYEGTPADFAAKRRQPKMPTSEYGNRIPQTNWPADKNWLYTTIVIRDPASDPGSAHLLNVFDSHPWLQQLKSKTHYRVLKTGDAQYRSYFSQTAPPSSLPAIVIQRPIPGTGEGIPIYRVPAGMLPSHPDRLAYEISTAIQQNCPDGRCRPYQPQPYQPYQPQPYQPYNPYPNDGGGMTPITPFNPTRPQDGGGFGQSQTLLIVGAIALVAVFAFIFNRRS